MPIVEQALANVGGMSVCISTDSETKVRPPAIALMTPAAASR